MQLRRSCGRWRLLMAAPRSGAENMARDTALLARAARTGETVFSIYSWEKPTISFGRHQPAAQHYDRQRISAAAMDVVRRPTGGRAILHHHEVTYSVTAPLDGEPLRDAYARINRILIAGLARLGVRVSVAAAALRHEAPTPGPCFESPAEGELVLEGKKLVGSAQWRDEGALLQHGSILLDDDQTTLEKLASRAGESTPAFDPPATLRAALRRSPRPLEVAAVMFDAVRSLEDSGATTLDEDDIREEALKRVPQYLDESWTWRR